MSAAHAKPAALSAHAFGWLCVSVGWTLLMHVRHLPIMLSVPLATVLLARWWQGRRRPPARVPVWLKLPLVALLIAVLLSHYGSIFGRLPGAALAVGLLVLKTLETSTTRDARSAIAFGFFTLMSALLFDHGLIASVLTGLGLLPALATLRALQPGLPRIRTRSELTLPAAMALVSMPLALAGFLFVPRLSTPLWGGAKAPTQAHTGLASQMTPGNFSKLLTDASPAMRVTFDGPPPPNDERYFRAFVMNFYDGRSWRPVSAPHAPEPVQAQTTIGYSISLEPTAWYILPTLDVPLEAPPHSHMLRNRSVYSHKLHHTRHVYRLRSALRYRFAPNMNRRALQRDLQLPHGYNPRTHALAARWRTRYGNDDLAIANAALRLFHDGGFVYTLTPPPLGRNSVDDFLFNTKQGFCEHYASAFTVLMRAAGVPARVVTGYQGGYWNDVANYLLVRNSDAHAWSEVWLAGRGWVRFDPTAAVRPQRIEIGAAAAVAGQLPWYQSGWARALRDQWDTVNRLWNQGVVGFDRLRQQGLLTPFGVRRASWNKLAMALAIACTGLLALAAAVTLWRRPRRDRLAAAQRRLQRKLARAGVVRRANEGPRDYLRRAAQALPACARQLDALGARYLWLRYGQTEPAAEPIRAFARQVLEFHPRAAVK